LEYLPFPKRTSVAMVSKKKYHKIFNFEFLGIVDPSAMKLYRNNNLNGLKGIQCLKISKCLP
jgi:hypothetical protein